MQIDSPGVATDVVQMEVANAAANAIEARHGTRWERGNSCEVICTYYTLPVQPTKSIFNLLTVIAIEVAY